MDEGSRDEDTGAKVSRQEEESMGDRQLREATGDNRKRAC
jgi:hypothetical protein